MRRQSLLLAIAALILSTSGCARLASKSAAGLMVQAPNRLDPRIRWTSLRPVSPSQGGFDERFWVEVGPPRAHLLVSIVDPRPGGARPVGTILLLHGAYDRSESMLKAANTFRAHGYRAVLVDMRGHGRSTGARITYGVQESKDISQVIDSLDRRGLLAGKLGVYGFSFGAASAIELAGRDPRVSAVVAVAPFSSFHDAASHAIQTRMPVARLFANEQWIDETIREAGRRGGFDWRAASPLAAIQRTDAMVLLVHGDADRFVEPYHSIRLHRAAPDRSRVALIAGANHHDLATDEKGTAASLALEWFNCRILDPG